MGRGLRLRFADLGFPAWLVGYIDGNVVENSIGCGRRARLGEERDKQLRVVDDVLIGPVYWELRPWSAPIVREPRGDVFSLMAIHENAETGLVGVRDDVVAALPTAGTESGKEYQISY